MESRRHDLQHRLNEHDEARRALESELRATGETLRTTESMVRDRDAALADAAKSIADANELTAAGERTIATLRHTIEDRDFKIAELEAAAVQQSAKLDMLRSTFFEAKNAHKEQIAELSARNDEQRQALAGLSAEHARLKQELTAHETRVAELEHRRCDLEQQLALRNEAIATHEADDRARSDELAAARRDLQDARASIACAEAQQRTEAVLRAETESRLAAAETQKQALETRISAQEAVLDERALELRDLQGAALDLAQARAAADASNRQVEDLNRSLAHSASLLRQRECAITLLVALTGSPTLLLPPPAAEASSAGHEEEAVNASGGVASMAG